MASPPHAPSPLARVRLEDVAPHDGAAAPGYARAVGALDASLARRGAAVLELPAADAAVVRCALESARAFFRGRPAVYLYRAGRTLEDGELSPACMADAFRCLGKVARASLSAIARHLHLRTDIFNHLLDDAPLPVNEVSSSELLVAYCGQTLVGCLESSMPVVDKGFVTLVASDRSGVEESHGNFVGDPSLRSVLSDPLSGAFLEDAMVLQCGHSFGGLMLKKITEMTRCTICNRDVDPASLFPNLALRAVATVVKMEDDRRLFHNAALRKRRKDVTEHADVPKRTGSNSRGEGELVLDAEIPAVVKAVQYPFVVGERVLIVGNKRTPEKFVGKEAVVTSQCLNGWYLVKALDNGESTRLQYRSLRKAPESQTQARMHGLTFLRD